MPSTISDYSLKAGIIKSSKQDIISRLEWSLESLENPSHSDFFKAARDEMFALEEGRRLLDDEFKAAYEEADRRYNKARSEFMEKRSALEFAIKHYQDQIKLELAHALIDLDGE